MNTNAPLILDLGLSDLEYLQLLAQGRDPVREQLYTQELIGYGFDPDYARQAAPLFDKPDCSIAEKILLNQTLRQLWKLLTQ